MIPVLYLLDAFDGNNQQQIRFRWSGAQSFGNICIIRDNVSNNIVYQATQATMQLIHTIPANTLTNGKLYNVRIASIDVNGTVSDYSNPILFYCYTTPTFELTNITGNQVIKNSSYHILLVMILAML